MTLILIWLDIGEWMKDRARLLKDESGNNNTGYLRGGIQFTPSLARIYNAPLGVIAISEPGNFETWFVDSLEVVSWAAVNVSEVDIELNRDYPAGQWESIRHGSGSIGELRVACQRCAHARSTHPCLRFRKSQHRRHNRRQLLHRKR